MDRAFLLGEVMDLVEGKGHLFHDAGEFALKGYEHAAYSICIDYRRCPDRIRAWTAAVQIERGIA